MLKVCPVKLASRKIHTGKIEREHKMKIKMKIMLATLALGVSAFVAGAQDDNGGHRRMGNGAAIIVRRRCHW